MKNTGMVYIATKLIAFLFAELYQLQKLVTIELALRFCKIADLWQLVKNTLNIFIMPCMTFKTMQRNYSFAK